MSLELKRIVLFVEDLEKQAGFYSDRLDLPVIEAREGWVEFDAGGCSIALHRGKRKPRLDLTASGSLEETRADLKAKGVKLRDLKEDALGRGSYCRGNDPEGNPFQISTGF